MKKSSQELSKIQQQQSATKWERRKARWTAWKNEQAKAKAEEMMLERSREER